MNNKARLHSGSRIALAAESASLASVRQRSALSLAVGMGGYAPFYATQRLVQRDRSNLTVL